MKELSEQEQIRRDKLDQIREYTNPYPDSFERTHLLKEAKTLEDGTKDVSIAGRIVFMRKMGKLSFVKIRDIESDMQLEVKVDEVGEEAYELFGNIPNIVFPSSAMVDGDKLLVYYGAADTTSCVASCDLNELLEEMVIPEEKGELFIKSKTLKIGFESKPKIMPNSEDL